MCSHCYSEANGIAKPAVSTMETSGKESTGSFHPEGSRAGAAGFASQYLSPFNFSNLMSQLRGFNNGGATDYYGAEQSSEASYQQAMQQYPYGGPYQQESSGYDESGADGGGMKLRRDQKPKQGIPKVFCFHR